MSFQYLNPALSFNGSDIIFPGRIALYLGVEIKGPVAPQ